MEEPLVLDAQPPAHCAWTQNAELTQASIKAVIQQFPAASGAGPSQLRPAHLKESLFCGCSNLEDSLLRSLQSFVTTAASGHLPIELSELLTSAKLIPLKKKNAPADVRPIACGETLRRVLEQVILRAVLPKAKEFLEPVQLGVGVKDATAHNAVAMSRVLPKVLSSPSLGILQVDISNAFNTVSRACIIRQVQERLPELYPWAVWSLSRRSLLFCQDEQLSSECGVHQGSPLGPLQFSLALHEVIKPLCEQMQLQPDAWAGFYLDDGNAFALLETLERFLAALRSRLPAIGLSLNLRKTVLLTTCPEVSHPNLAQVTHIDPSSPAGGFKVLGIPMDGAQFVADELAHTVEQVSQFCARILQLEHPQAALLILRMCCGTCRVIHLLKILPAEMAETLSLDVDELMLNTFTKLIGSLLRPVAKQQFVLSIRYGGFGLTRAAALTPAAAFVGQWSFEERGRSLLNFHSDDGIPDWASLLRRLCSSLPATCMLPSNWLAEGRLPSPAEDQWLHLKFWSAHIHSKTFGDLLANCNGRDIVRLQCQKNTYSGAWLNAIPAEALGLEISPAICRIVWKWWLGEVLYGADASTVVCPFCHGCADCYGDHIMCCDKAEFTTRHEAIVSQLTHFLQAGGVAVQNNVGVGGRERPADIYVSRWTDSEPLAVDVTVTHPLAPHLGVSQQQARAALRAKERQKIAKYEELLQRSKLNFLPFPITTFGELSEHASAFVDDAAVFYSAHQQLSFGDSRTQLLQRIEVALMQQVGRRLLACCSVLQSESTTAAVA